MLFFEMTYNNKNIFWYVLFAPYGKATKIISFLEAADIEYFYPMYYQERRLRDSERKKLIFQPILRNLLFVRSSKKYLDAVLKEAKIKLGINSYLYYRDLGSRKLIIVPEVPMQNFIAIAGNVKEHIIYLSNDEVNMKKGTKIRIIGGIFEGIEGIFMKIRGNNRVVVSLPDLLSVATAYIPTRFILPIE